ncbi:MAG: 1-deoxy-D-xylulose-5-phosphate synthase [Planctomycetota bacterium]
MSLLPSLTGPQDLRRMSLAELEELAADVRRAIVEQISRSGGHLAPNLGVVELTIALHRAFDFAHDRLLFDVGHQCYPHKLLTGRQGLLPGLRTSAGIAGFPEPSESEYDLFRVGHAGTGISTAVGMAMGDRAMDQAFHSLRHPDGRRVVTLVGDASIVNGVAMEGLNAAGTLDRQLLVVLNDNGMSISPPQGAISNRLSDHLERAHAWFEAFGHEVHGPVDGHDLGALEAALEAVGRRDRPVLLHVKTVKGKGLDFAEQDATTFHSPSPFRMNGCRVEVRSGGRSFTASLADHMAELMERDERVVALTAAMLPGTGLDKVARRFPGRVIDTGICESHAMDVAAGMAKAGLRPYFCVYSTFLQRAFDQAFQEVSLQGLPVRLCLDRAGLVGGDGAVHHGFCDVSILRTLPGAALTAAVDEPSLAAALEFLRGYEEGLSSVRYPRDEVDTRLGVAPPFELGKARCLTPQVTSPDVAVLAFGTPALAALDAAEAVAGELQVAVWDARFAKPVDVELIRELLASGCPIVTVEDHTRIGGFGSAVLEFAQEEGLDASRVLRLGLPDRWIRQDSRKKQLQEAGLDAQGIAAGIRQAAGLRVLAGSWRNGARDGSGRLAGVAQAAPAR